MSKFFPLFFKFFSKIFFTKFFFQNSFFKIFSQNFFSKMFFTICFSKLSEIFLKNFFFEASFFKICISIYRDKTDSMNLCYEKYDIQQAVEIELSSRVICKVLFFSSYCSHHTALIILYFFRNL